MIRLTCFAILCGQLAAAVSVMQKRLVVVTGANSGKHCCLQLVLRECFVPQTSVWCVLRVNSYCAHWHLAHCFLHITVVPVCAISGRRQCSPSRFPLIMSCLFFQVFLAPTRLSVAAFVLHDMSSYSGAHIYVSLCLVWLSSVALETSRYR